MGGPGSGRRPGHIKGKADLKGFANSPKGYGQKKK